jgi:hypothetical protein
VAKKYLPTSFLFSIHLMLGRRRLSGNRSATE